MEITYIIGIDGSSTVIGTDGREVGDSEEPQTDTGLEERRDDSRSPEGREPNKQIPPPNVTRKEIDSIRGRIPQVNLPN